MSIAWYPIEKDQAPLPNRESLRSAAVSAAAPPASRRRARDQTSRPEAGGPAGGTPALHALDHRIDASVRWAVAKMAADALTRVRP